MSKRVLALECIWICALSFQYGYHISALNSLYSAIDCKTRSTLAYAVIPECFAMTPYKFGLLSSIYTVGGLVGSLITGTVADAHGRKRACLLGSLAIGTGAVVMSLAPAFSLMVAGRAIVGVGCGVATVIVPTFLSEIAPADRKGSIGVLNQLGIVTGIFVGQASSLALAGPKTWRYVTVISGVLAALQILSASNMVESPVWISRHTGTSDDDEPSRTEEARRLLDGSPEVGESGTGGGQPPSRMLDVLKSPITRRGIRIVIVTQIAQQASGINAVLYYSTDIMKNALPTSAGYIALLITAINLIMTFPPMYLIDRIGRRPLLLLSSSLMCITALLLSMTITSSPALASTFIVLFVSAFSIGLGPIPFVIIPEVVPPASAAATGSLGLSLNWIVNFIVGISFPPLQQSLGPQGVFVMFSIIVAVSTILMALVYR